MVATVALIMLRTASLIHAVQCLTDLLKQWIQTIGAEGVPLARRVLGQKITGVLEDSFDVLCCRMLLASEQRRQFFQELHQGFKPCPARAQPKASFVGDFRQ